MSLNSEKKNGMTTEILIPKTLAQKTKAFFGSTASFLNVRRTVLGVCLAIMSAPMMGCASSNLSDFTGSIGELGSSLGSSATSADLPKLGAQYDEQPGSKQVSLAYAAALRHSGQYVQAVAVLQQASIENIGDQEVAGAYGKALADVGRFEEAMNVLPQAHTDDRPDWSVLSTMGAVQDQLGKHDAAREYYRHALQIAPEEPSVLSNYGLSYLLTRDLDQAEELLRRAAAQPGADPRVNGNLNLVASLRQKQGQAYSEVPTGSTSSEARNQAKAAPTKRAARARKTRKSRS